MASIGKTRPDRTPHYWRSDYRLSPGALAKINALHAEKKQLFAAFENLPDDLPEDDYKNASLALTLALDKLLDREDTVRRQNK